MDDAVVQAAIVQKQLTSCEADASIQWMTVPPCDDATTRVAPLCVQRGAVLLPNQWPKAGKLRRRFYHLGVERTDLPLGQLSSSGEEGFHVAYIPTPAVGFNSQQEAQRRIEYNATGAPPPKPKYFSDIDRCKHFVQPRGGMDVGAHFLYRPQYQLSTGDAPVSAHTSMLKELLLINKEQLIVVEAEVVAMKRYSTGRDASTGAHHDQQPQLSPPSKGLPLLCDRRADSIASRLSQPSASPSPDPTQAFSPSSSCPSLDVARSGSSLAATQSVRRLNQLKNREKELRHLTKMGHPNQVTVYLPQ